MSHKLWASLFDIYRLLTSVSNSSTYLSLSERCANSKAVNELSGTVPNTETTLLEALSVGCIPICSPVGGIVNVINSGQNGLLSKDSTENEVYKTISCFLEMPEDSINDMKQSASNSFNKYDIKSCAANYLKKYELC